MTFVSTHPADMSSTMLLDTIPSPDSETPSSAPRFRPYASPNHHVTKGRYITSNDPRGYIPVFEYPLNGQWIMLDMDDGYVLWTGIWKALGNSKADIVKMVESQPDLASKLRRVRGGYLKIQGTWMPYEIALRLARRVAWPIRHELVPLFGPTFPTTCLSPDQPGYGQVVKPAPGKRRTRRHREAARAEAAAQDWTIISPAGPHACDEPAQGTLDGLFTYQPRRSTETEGRHHLRYAGSSVELYMPYSQAYATPTSTSPPPLETLTVRQLSLSCSSSNASTPRYAPYPSPLSPGHRASRSPPGIVQRRRSSSAMSDDIRLPPLVVPDGSGADRRSSSFSLPPISALDGLRQGQCDDSAAVLKRLQSLDDDDLGLSSSHSSYSSICHRRTGLSSYVGQQQHPSSLPLSSRAVGPSLSAIPPSSSGRVSPPVPYLTPISPHSHGSINDLALHRLPTPPPSRSSLEDARTYLSPRSSEGSVQERGLMSAARRPFRGYLDSPGSSELGMRPFVS